MAVRLASLGIAASVLVVDQLTKALALRSLDDGRVTHLLGDLLSLRLVANAGAAFSIGTGSTWVFTILALAVSIFVTREIARGVTNRWWVVTLGALLGGALGNLADRVFRPPALGRGHVVDFIDYAGFFVGNVADIAIVGSAVVIAWLSFRDIPLRARPHHPGPAS